MYKILAINSMPAYGNAGLKCVLSILQTHTVPVPSLVLSGLGNVAGHQRFTYDFQSNLMATFGHLQTFEEKAILYVGYLAAAEQVNMILEAIDKFKSNIHGIVVDPVCGDNGKAYVADKLIENWQLLLQKADWATPNVTELQLLSGCSSLDEAILQTNQNFPHTNWIITSYPIEPGKISNHLIVNDLQRDFSHPEKPQKISGAGDAFASYFILHHYLHQKTPVEAVACATNDTLVFIDELLLSTKMK